MWPDWKKSRLVVSLTGWNGKNWDIFLLEGHTIVCLSDHVGGAIGFCSSEMYGTKIDPIRREYCFTLHCTRRPGRCFWLQALQTQVSVAAGADTQSRSPDIGHQAVGKLTPVEPGGSVWARCQDSTLTIHTVQWQPSKKTGQISLNLNSKLI